MKHHYRVTGALALVLAAPTIAADPANKEAELFGAREAVRGISISPDGTQIAIVASTPGGAGTVLLTGKLGGVLKPALRASGEPEQLIDCNWSTDVRIVCDFVSRTQQGDGLLLGYTRTVSLDPDGGNLKRLTAATSERALYATQFGGTAIDWLGEEGGGSVLMTRPVEEQRTTGSLAASNKRGLGVDRVDTTTLRRTPVEQPEPTAIEYITDGHGTVRVRGLRPSTNTGYGGGEIVYQYRAPGSRSWKELSRHDFTEGGAGNGFNPWAVDRDLNIAYGFDRDGDRQALYKMSLDGTGKAERVFAHPSVDVDGLVRIGRENRVVGVSYATEKRETSFFDPELARLRTGLARALPKAPLISFVDASAGEKKLVLRASSDVDPGRYYVYDKATRQLGPLVADRPQLDGLALAPVRPVSFPASDGTAIPGYLTLPVGSTGKNLPTIVMPHGGPGARDEWGFDWLAQYFAARGFAVLQPNFRGSTGYGERWFAKNGFRSWRTAIGDVSDGARWLAKQGIADPAKMAAVGWSYGGYAALQSAVVDPALFKAVVAIAPVTDLETLRDEARRYSNFSVRDKFIGYGPHVREGSPAQNAAAIKAPVLLFHGDQDQNVGVGESRLMQSRLKAAGGRVELIEFPGLGHGLDDDRARIRMLTRADAFLRESMGM